MSGRKRHESAWLMRMVFAFGACCAGTTSMSVHATQSRTMSASQLDQLLAPVALYPDGLLAQILVASKYPDAVASAAAWTKTHPDLAGQAAVKAASTKTWDASVKSLTAFPAALQMMAANPSWLRNLSQQFQANPASVMQSTQRLRKMAMTAKTLKSGEQQTVVAQGDIIKIVPANPKVIYVPTYNPTVVYGAWPYRDYPPGYGYVPVGHVGVSGIGFSIGVALTTPLWSSVNWGARNIVVNYGDVNLGRAGDVTNINYNGDTYINNGNTYVAGDVSNSGNTSISGDVSNSGNTAAPVTGNIENKTDKPAGNVNDDTGRDGTGAPVDARNTDAGRTAPRSTDAVDTPRETADTPQRHAPEHEKHDPDPEAGEDVPPPSDSSPHAGPSEEHDTPHPADARDAEPGYAPHIEPAQEPTHDEPSPEPAHDDPSPEPAHDGGDE